MKKLILFLPLCVFIISCSVQKRKYQKGYYIAWHKPAAQKEKKEPLPARKNAQTTALAVAPEMELPRSVTKIVADGGNNPATALLQKQKISFLSNPDSCDEITFRNGDLTKAKITEINPTELKYKRCDVEDGPLYVVKKSEIFMVKYLNGTKEVFPIEPNNIITVNGQPRSEQRITHPDALAALILGLTGLFFYYGSIHAIIIGRRVLREINAQPYKYKGEGMARAGIALGIIKLALVLLLLILIFGLLL